MKPGKGRGARRARPQPVLTTRRLRLRRLLPSDAEAVFRYCSDPAVTRYMIFETHRDLAETRRIIRRLERGRLRSGAPHWAITLRRSKELIGMCGFQPFEPQHRRGEVGYWLGRPHWGQGYATEAVGALLAFGFRKLKLNRLQARVFTPNRASARVLEKAGMKREGTLRQFEQIKGRFPDVHFYSMLRQEFVRRKRGKYGLRISRLTFSRYNAYSPGQWRRSTKASPSRKRRCPIPAWRKRSSPTCSARPTS